MQRHVVMSDFAQFLIDRVGAQHVWVLTDEQDLKDHTRGFETQQQSYFWSTGEGVSQSYATGKPNAHLNHHTASSAYTPNVRNAEGKTKANAYLGARRGGRLYQFADGSDEGVPTVALAAAGPANYSAGSGNKEFLAYALNDRRFNGPQRNADENPKWYGNRYYWNTEVIAKGDGSPLLAGVWDLLVEYNRALRDYLNWSTWRLGGHYDHTRRKIDLKVEQGNPYSVGLLQDIIEMSEAPEAPPVVIPPGEWRMEVKYGDGFDNRSPERQPSVAAFQGALKLRSFDDDNSQSADGVDGKYGRGTERACKAFQASVNLPVTGIGDVETRKQAETW